MALLDGDDWWAKDKLATVAEALEKNPAIAAVGHGYYQFEEASGTTTRCAPPARSILTLQTPGAVRFSAYLLPSFLTVRRRVLQWISPIPEEMIFMADSALEAAATVMGALILEEPLSYYRRHADNLYSIDPGHVERAARKSRMAEIAYGGVCRRLLELGVPEESVSELLGFAVIEAKRANLGYFGGTRRKVFETEMQAFHAAFKRPSLAYRLYKYLVMGVATLLLPPRGFYAIRDWYAKHQLGRIRERIAPGDRGSSNS